MMQIARYISPPSDRLEKPVWEIVDTNERISLLSESHGGKASHFTAWFYRCPVPPWHHEAARRPFELTMGEVMPWLMADYNASSIDSPEFQQLWTLVPTLDTPNHFMYGDIRFSDVSKVRVRSRFNVEGNIDCSLFHFGKPAESAPLKRFMEFAGLNPDSDQPAAGNRCLEMRSSGVPADSYLTRLRHAFEQFVPPNCEASFKIAVGGAIEEPFDQTGHDQQRPLLNNITRNWVTKFPAAYTRGFDPFARPEQIPQDTEELRYPVVCYETRKTTLPKL